jgi:cytochrome P450
LIAGKTIWTYRRCMASLTGDAGRADSTSRPVPAAGPPDFQPGTGWVVTGHDDVRAVLSRPAAYQVPAVAAGGPAGSVSWLRSAVSRFSNGSDHARRRALAVAELGRIMPGALRADAERRSHALLDAAGGGAVDVMTALARRVPMAALAAAAGLGDPEAAAEHAIVTAAAYFPGASAEREAAAADSVTALARMFRPAGLAPDDPAADELIAARIAVLVQACDATAGLIGKAICRALPAAPESGGPAGGPGRATSGPAPATAWPTEQILAEVLRHDPPLRVMRRICTQDTELDGRLVAAGTAVLLRVDAANRDPAVYSEPDKFAPGRPGARGLTFGAGPRRCPADEHAVMLAAGVVQAVRDRCGAVCGPAEYEAAAALSVPVRLMVALR